MSEAKTQNTSTQDKMFWPQSTTAARSFEFNSFKAPVKSRSEFNAYARLKCSRRTFVTKQKMLRNHCTSYFYKNYLQNKYGEKH
jgi:hypothetical protein